MLNYRSILNEEVVDTDNVKATDSGGKGKEFERDMIKAFKLLGLDFTINRATGAVWDVAPKGSGWEKLINDKNVNIKVSTTKWMFASSELVKMLPWEGPLPDDFDSEKAAAKVKRFINKRGVSKTVFLKPISKEIQSQIKAAVQAEDIPKLNKLFIKKNFYTEKLGKKYNIRVLTRGGERVTSIAIDKDNKVFMRSEKPRKMGGSMMVTFRTPTTKLGKGTQRKLIKEIKVKSYRELLL